MFDEKNPPMVLLVLFLKDLPHSKIVKKGIQWVNENSKWSCKVDEEGCYLCLHKRLLDGMRLLWKNCKRTPSCEKMTFGQACF